MASVWYDILKGFKGYKVLKAIMYAEINVFINNVMTAAAVFHWWLFETFSFITL